MLDYYLLYFLAILPAIFIVIYVYNKDQFPEDKSEVIITFLLGTSIVLFLDLLIPITEAFNDTFFDGYGNIAFMQYFRAATLEETLKFLVVYYYAYRLKNFDEPMDAVVFAVAASLGFAATENVDYLWAEETQQGALDLAFLRASTAIPLHALCGVVMGLFFGLAVFGERNNQRNLFLALLLPIAIHGSYNFLLSTGFGLLVIYIILFTLLIKTSKIFQALVLDQNLREEEILQKRYFIHPTEIYMNVLKITGIIIILVISLEVFTNN